MYYFMKLGHLLTIYVEGYELQKQLLEGYLGEDFKTANAVFPIREDDISANRRTRRYVLLMNGQVPTS